MRTVTATTDIEATAERVWRQLTDTGEFPAWNPFITRLTGTLAVGERLDVTIAPPGGRAMRFRPEVVHVEPYRRLEWVGRLGVPGLFDGRHGFTLEALDAGRTRFVQQESFSGLLVPFTATVLTRVEAGFQAMNDALRRRAEAGTTGTGQQP